MHKVPSCDFSNYCWASVIGAMLIGLIVLISATSFPTAGHRDVPTTNNWSALDRLRNETASLAVTGHKTLVALTREVWVLTAAILIVLCLGMLTIMLCGLSAENLARLLTIVACLFMVGVSVGFYFRPDLLERVIVEIKQMGLWGNLLMGLSFLIISFPLTIGCVVLAMCCGFIYGLLIGSITACLGLFLGGLLAFWGCSKLLKAPVLRYARAKPKLAAILQALRENGWYVSIALRVSPVPLGLQNGLLAVTVPINVYMGSLPFAFPEQILFAYFGKEAEQLMDLIAGKQAVHPGQVWLMIFDVAVGLLLFAATVFFGRRVVARAMDGRSEPLLLDEDEIYLPDDVEVGSPKKLKE